MEAALTPEIALRFAGTALGHVTRPWPYKLDHVMTCPEDVRPPRELHPIFFGSFDWHSCVHGHWTLARIRRRFPTLALADEIERLFDAQFTTKKVEAAGANVVRFSRPKGAAKKRRRR